MPIRYLPQAIDVLLQTALPRPGSPGEGSTAGSLLLEHGLAERIMLVYERFIKDQKSGEGADLPLINRTARIAKSCLTDCHERNEERWLFPLFREEGYLTDMADALEQQHAAGREVTDKIIDLSTPGRIKDETHVNILMTLCRSYVFMYRPHISRENSELFPRLSHIATPGVIDDLGGKMAESTRESLGEQGFAGPLRELAEIEQSLDIHDVRSYTIGYG
ncbi:MAG TPA: hemerythrin domain-containing protein [Methanocella sp.]